MIVFFAVLYIGLYNSIVSARNSVEENKSTIETIFQNRYDLIPNLVEVVKQYADHEKELLRDVTELRSNAMNNQNITKEKLQNENQISSSLKSMFALGENYPDLKANQNFINLQNQWQEIEDRMQAARRWYNSAVKVLRNKKQQIPSNIVASGMNLQDYPMFEADKEARKNLNAKDMFAK